MDDTYEDVYVVKTLNTGEKVEVKIAKVCPILGSSVSFDPAFVGMLMGTYGCDMRAGILGLDGYAESGFQICFVRF